MQERSPDQPLEVWIDGACSLCRRSEQWCTVRDRDHRLRFRDLHEAGNDKLPRSREAMITSVHLRLPNGTIATGFDAWRHILRELPGWRWLVAVAGLPLFRRLGSKIYDAVARNRHRLVGSEGSPLVHGHGRTERSIGRDGSHLDVEIEIDRAEFGHGEE